MASGHRYTEAELHDLSPAEEAALEAIAARRRGPKASVPAAQEVVTVRAPKTLTPR